ncbi:MAG: DeoR family transcriptional regulator [Nitrososphaerales archaeon]|nr:DeoR family transcriptional regulator [Nitrososphaerales archaeon]
MCPRCGGRGSGPFLKRMRGNHFGLYFEHVIIENGARRIVWHYIPKSGTSKRREELLRLIGKEGWMSAWHYASILKVSERTIRRDVFVLRASGLLIHRKRGSYIADPTGAILKENPWLAW